MPGDDALGQIARNVGNLERRVHMLESITRPQARARIASIFKRDLSVAVGLLAAKADTQQHLATIVSRAISRSASQVAMSRELRRLKGLGVVGRAKGGGYFVEQAWLDVGLDAELRRIAKKMGLKVDPRRRSSR